MSRQACNLTAMDWCFGAALPGFTWTNGFPPTVGGLVWAIATPEYRTAAITNNFLILLRFRFTPPALPPAAALSLSPSSAPAGQNPSPRNRHHTADRAHI